MIFEQRQIMYGQSSIDFQVERRDRKTLEIAVEPDLRVLIAAPINADITEIDAKVRKRAAWIKRQQTYFRQFLPRTPPRRYVGGETHLYLGRQYRLKIQLAVADHVRFYRGYIHVHSTRPHNEAHTKSLVSEWYKQRARIKFEERLQHCVSLFSRPEAFTPKALIVRTLQLRWGSMSAAHRLLLNRRLIEAPIDAIDYVITHELCHMQELHHGPKFYGLLSSSMPDWRARKSKLERVMS